MATATPTACTSSTLIHTPTHTYAPFFGTSLLLSLLLPLFLAHALPSVPACSFAHTYAPTFVFYISSTPDSVFAHAPPSTFYLSLLLPMLLHPSVVLAPHLAPLLFFCPCSSPCSCILLRSLLLSLLLHTSFVLAPHLAPLSLFCPCSSPCSCIFILSLLLSLLLHPSFEFAPLLAPASFF